MARAEVAHVFRNELQPKPPAERRELLDALVAVTQWPHWVQLRAMQGLTARRVLGVGIGWLAGEFAALGVPFAERGASTDEYIEALRVLWREAEPTFEGRFCRFDRAKSYPKPAQPGGIPIVIGGQTEPAAR